MHSFGVIFLLVACVVAVLGGLYGAAPLFLRPRLPGSRPRIRIKSADLIDPRAMMSVPGPGTKDSGSPVPQPKTTLTLRTADELFSEILAIRQGMSEMSAQISDLRESLEASGSGPGHESPGSQARSGRSTARAA